MVFLDQTEAAVVLTAPNPLHAGRVTTRQTGDREVKPYSAEDDMYTLRSGPIRIGTFIPIS